jgi:hypothetical protein
VDRSGSVSCSTVDFGLSGAENLSSVTIVLVGCYKRES